MAEPQRSIIPRPLWRWLLAAALGATVSGVTGAEVAPQQTEPEAAAPAVDGSAQPAEDDAAQPQPAAESAPAGGPESEPPASSPSASDAADSQPTDESAAEAEPPPAADPVADYLDAIDRVEMAQGAYSPELADMYLGLGNALLKERNFQEARTAFQKGMQVQRVSEGLNSLSQEPYLFSLADLESALGDGKAANDAMADIYRINASAYEAMDARMLPVLERMLVWYLTQHSSQAAKTGFLYLENAENIARQMAAIHVETLQLADAGAADAFRKMAAVHYALIKHVQVYGLPDDDQVFGHEFSANPVPLLPQPSPAQIYFRRGESALEKVVEVLDKQPDVAVVRKAQALAELGDWYTAFGQVAVARDYYRQAYQQVAAAGEQSAELGQSLFGQPRLIDLSAQVAPAAEDSAVAVVLDVTAKGEPKNLQVDDLADRLGEGEVKKLKRAILKLRFRPQLQEGSPIRTEGFAYRHPWRADEGDHEKS